MSSKSSVIAAAHVSYHFTWGRVLRTATEYPWSYYFRVTGAHDTVLDYAGLFSITLRNDNVEEFDTRWMKF